MTIASPPVAEKIFLSGCVLLLPLAFRYALGALHPEARDLWPLILPFVYNHFLHLGYYNLAFAGVPFFLVLGYWARRRGRLAPGETVALALLLLFLYFCHLVTLLLALGALGVLASWLSVRELREGAAGRSRVAGLRVFALATAALPVVLLALWFLAGQRSERSDEGPSLLERWADLWRLRELASHDERELWLTGALGVLLLVVAAALVAVKLRPPSWSDRDGLLLVAATFAVVYFLAPVTVLNTPGSTPGGGTTHDRVSLYVFFVLLLWIATQDLRPASRRGLVGTSVALAVGLLALRLPRYAELNADLAEYLAPAALITRHATLLPVSFAHQGRRLDGSPVSWRVKAFLHGGAYLAAERDLVDFTNYEADLGYFPTLFRRDANPYRWLRKGQELQTPCLDFARYDRRAPRPLDFVLVWAGAPGDPRDPCAAAIFEHLDKHYELVDTSKPRGLARLYRRRTAGVG